MRASSEDLESPNRCLRLLFLHPLLYLDGEGPAIESDSPEMVNDAGPTKGAVAQTRLETVEPPWKHAPFEDAVTR